MSDQPLRHEIKFAAYTIEFERVCHWFKLQGLGFFEPFPERRVNSVYFDSWDFRAFSDNLAGISRRTKVRYRWYGASDLPTDGVLEVKQKRNQLGSKLRFPIEGVAGKTSWRDITGAIEQGLPQDALHWLQFYPQPMIMNRYRRRYFESADRRIRATIDTEQVAYDQRPGDRPNISSPAISEDRLVVEFKFAPEDWTMASKVVNGFPFRIGRHSKYINSVRAVAML